MEKKTVLRIAIFIELLAFVCGIAFERIMFEYLPEGLQNYYLEVAESSLTSHDILFIVVALLALLVNIIVSIGLLMLKGWARWPYVVSGCSMIAIIPFSWPTVEIGTITAIRELEVLAFGFVICLISFTNVLERKSA